MLTHQEWLALLGPVLTAVFGVLALTISVIGTGLIKRLGTWLDAKAGAETSKQVTDASTRVQNAMANEAGNIALEVQAGHLDLTDLAAVRARAVQGEAAIVAKLPTAVELLQPIEGAIAQGIAGKIISAGAPVAATSATAVLDALGGIRAEIQQQSRAVAA